MASKQLLLIYDDERPSCKNYTQIIRIKKTVGELVLINAREDGSETSE